ncbi:MAG: hypothetical protein RR725_06165 [Carnobacterium sp.]|uniref:DUF6884 domain-containing protein n=1 Tax=Carnobacterium sp. TaxID=48221 RepID=UPI002FC7E4BE
MFIIPSGKPKIWDKVPDAGAVPAKTAYTGTFHKLCTDYATTFGPNYLILSPYYGFLRPDDLVSHSYDVRFTVKGVGPDTIPVSNLKEQWVELAIEKDDQITLLGGKKFIHLMDEITDRNVIFPLIGLGGIGLMQKALKEAVHQQKPLN